MILDASLLVALVREGDAHHDAAAQWLLAAPEEEPLRAPSLALIEVAGALRRLGDDADRAHTAAVSIARSLDLILEPLTQDRAAAAAVVAAQTAIKGADAVYVALAEELGETLVTFDREQASRSRDLIRVEQPGLA